MEITFKNSQSNDWYIINDGVMGGLSKGKLKPTKEGVLFYGNVSLANNGGFTSYRSPWQRFKLAPYEKVSIRYRSEGISQAFVMETNQRFYLPNFKISLPATEGWETKTVALADFKQYRLGYPTGGVFTEEDKDKIIRIGFISDEKRAGDFSFEIVSITFE